MCIRDSLKSGTTYELVVGANTIDSLVENDAFGNIVPCAAESWEVSEDGLTWTFHLRQGQYWYDADGNQKDPVTAHDYVAAARYVCDANNACDNSYLMEGWLVNAEEAVYYTAYAAAALPKGTEKGKDQDAVIDENGIIYEGKSWEGDDETGVYTEWVEVPVVTPDQVGVVAVDDYTLQYNLVKPRPYFLTVLQFGTYWPAPAALLEHCLLYTSPFLKRFRRRFKRCARMRTGHVQAADVVEVAVVALHDLSLIHI